jgi:hypothetical protein
MGHFLALALAFPPIVYTVLLGVALVYWVFVMVGAAHVNLLGEGAGDAALDGVAKGAIEGATKGMLEGAAEHLEAPGGDGGHDLGDGADAHDGGSGGLMAALRLRSAPATVVLSFVLLFAWIVAMVGMQVFEAVLPASGVVVFLAKLALFVAAPALALFPTSVVVRPLARVFTPLSATKSEDLVGQVCRIRTGTVTERFGEAVLEDGGAGLVVRVRVDAGEKLGRGDEAVIVGYDAERQEFTVAPVGDLLSSPSSSSSPPRSKRAR